MDPCNFRPISVLCHVSKIFEKVVQCQLVTFLVKHDFITLDQYAYRKFHSTTSCLHNTIDEWLQNIDDRLCTGICFLDISKCFDTIDHNILVSKMEKYGIRANELKWFKSYLRNRTQSVKHNNKLSKPMNVNIGVPQGSTLGPLLFTLFVNDLPIYISNGRCSMFADDTIVYCNDSNIANLNDKMNESLHEIYKWYSANRLVLNVSKSNSMLITPSNGFDDRNDFQMYLNGNPVKNVNYTKYLGVYIDDQLKFDYHVNELSKNISKKLAWLTRLRHIVPNNVLRLTYNTFIMPLFDYACSVWGCSRNNIYYIQRLQNRAARIICGNFDIVNTRGIDLVSSLGWQTIEQRINYFLGVTMYNCIHGTAPMYLCNSVVMACECNDRYTRLNDTMQVQVPCFKTDAFKRSFIYRSSVVWNNLPDHVQNANSLHQFKFLNKCNRGNTAND